MTALTTYRDTKRMGDDVHPDILEIKVADNVHIFKGAIVGLAGGYAAPAGAACSKVVGIAESEIDNTQPGHAVGAKSVRVRQGAFKGGNTGGADALAGADLGNLCYAADDQTVAKTVGCSGTTCSPARVAASGRWWRSSRSGSSLRRSSRRSERARRHWRSRKRARRQCRNASICPGATKASTSNTPIDSSG